jgi:SPP1 family predicted phage head-tail adaptor
MRFGDMRDRIVILSPGYSYINDLDETVPAWAPFRPYAENNPQELPLLTVTEGAAQPQYLGTADENAVQQYAIWAQVTPLNGREYEESQKLRAETTYSIKIRYAANIRSDFKVLYKNRLFEIISVLNLGSRNREIKLVCSEVDNYGKEEQ